MEGKYDLEAAAALASTPDVPLHLRLVEPLPRVEPCEPVRDGDER